ncbi:MAG: hypothetical protein EOO61_02965 [Hymenobacter sp.]|nr:MAG: hypothetical protein EOO61_02965 [Hymenobacter sp.]
MSARVGVSEPKLTDWNGIAASCCSSSSVIS